LSSREKIFIASQRFLLHILSSTDNGLAKQMNQSTFKEGSCGKRGPCEEEIAGNVSREALFSEK